MVIRKRQPMYQPIIVAVIIITVVIVAALLLFSNNSRTVCNSPYIQVGTGCCLDQTLNGICDKDETEQTPAQEEAENLEISCRSDFNCPGQGRIYEIKGGLKR